MARLLQLAISMIVILGVAYLLGHGFLVRGWVGNDGHLHIAYAEWLDRYFPLIPHWYPNQGGGESLLHGYPLLPHLILVIVHRVTGLTIAGAFSWVSFLVFPLTALSVYLLAWSLLKTQTGALLAAVFYLVSPLTWVWSMDWGFFGQAVAMVTLPLILLAYDRYISPLDAGTKDARRKYWLVCLVVLLAWTLLAHPAVWGGAMAGLGFWSLFYAITGSPRGRVRLLSQASVALAWSGVLTGLLLLFYLLPFYIYGSIAGRGGINNPAPHQILAVPVLQFLEVAPIDPTELWHRARFPLVVTVFFAVGALAAAKRSRKLLVLSLASIFATAYALTPELVAVVLRVSPLVYSFFSLRPVLVLSNVVVPIVSAFGAFQIGCLIVRPRTFFSSAAERTADGALRRALANAATSVLSLSVAAAGIFYLGQVFAVKPNSVLYGPAWHGIDLGNLWGREAVESTSIIDQLAPANWPRPSPLTSIPGWEAEQRLSMLLPTYRPLRIDISPYQGGLAMNFTTYTDTSQLNSYSFQLSLIHTMWGYQQNVFFSHEPDGAEYGNPVSLNNAAKWFGIQYVFLNPDWDPVEMYQAAGWQQIYEEGSLQIWNDPAAPQMATATSRPVILVIGKPETDAYMSVFRLANDGMLPYDEAFLVEGDPRIDSYSLEELGRFDALLLYGYDYRDSRRAWEILSAYVEGGGRLFVDTGWQYRIPEWEFEAAPEVLPLERLTWTNYGMTSEYQIQATDIAGDVNLQSFSPLIWESDPWSVSGATLEDVRGWGRVVLTAAGRPLVVAGQLGEGRVVWSGMNMMAHAYDNRNPEEVRFLHNVLSWLIADEQGQDFAVMVQRDHPDRVDIWADASSGRTTWLYFREAAYMNWHAYVESGDAERRELPIYQAGPGFMLMPMEGVSGNAHVELVWETRFVEMLAIGVSVLTAMALVAFVLDGLFLRGRVFGTVGGRLRRARRRPRREGSVEWLRYSTQGDPPRTHEPSDLPSPGGQSGGDAAHEAASETTPFLVEKGLADRAQVEALWDRLASSGKLDAQRDAEATRMISRRYSKEHPEGE